MDNTKCFMLIYIKHIAYNLMTAITFLAEINHHLKTT